MRMGTPAAVLHAHSLLYILLAIHRTKCYVIGAWTGSAYSSPRKAPRRALRTLSA